MKLIDRVGSLPFLLGCGFLVLVLTAWASIATPIAAPADDDDPEILGTVVDDSGARVSHALVKVLRDVDPGSSESEVQSSGEWQTTADDQGEFALEQSQPVLLEITAPGHRSRVVAAAPDTFVKPVLLKAAEAESVTIRAGGDVMFGRRFYETNKYGETLIEDPTSVEAHKKILEPIVPILDDSDVTAINLETALVGEKKLEQSFESRDGLHPTKDFVIVSSEAAAQALAESGVEVVSLANNHSYDALDEGIDSTITALDKAGVAHFGAGENSDEAWEPAIVEAKNGQKVGFVGCTTETGDQHEVTYVADDDKGGAARCEKERLVSTISDLKTQVDEVVVMIHGGVEYQFDQQPEVQELTTAAVEAGAVGVANHHPHIPGRLRMEDGAFVAESLGNLVFDQKATQTLDSGIARMDVKGGKLAHGSYDPIFLNGYVPRPAVGLLSDSVVRDLLPTDGDRDLPSPGPVPFVGTRPTEELEVAAGSTERIGLGQDITSIGSDSATVGRDLLLGTGSFNRLVVGEKAGQPSGWILGEHAQLSDQVTCGAEEDGTGASERGLVLSRGSLSTVDVVATIAGRIPVEEGQKLTLSFDVQSAQKGGTGVVSFYTALEGESFDSETVEIPPREENLEGCETVTLDVTVPKTAVAVQPFIELSPKDSDVAGRMIAVDDVRFVRWNEGNSLDFADTVRTDEDTVVTVESQRVD